MGKSKQLKQGKTIWIIDHYSSEPEYGGISRQYDFARELDRRGYRVIIFASGFSHFTYSYISNKQVFITKPFSHVRYIYLKTSSYKENKGSSRALNMVSFLWQVLRYESVAEKCYGKPDVVVGCSVHPLAWIAAYRISKKYNIRFVAEIRDFWPQVWIMSGDIKPLHPRAVFFEILEKWMFGHADRIIYSQYHGDRYICDEKGFPRNRTSLIGQVMDCERFDKNKKRLELLPENIRRFLEDGFICGFTGYYVKYNGVYTMLEAMKILQDRKLPVKMVFAGNGEEKESMLKYVKDYHLYNVLITDRIAREAVPALISRCDVCIAQAEREGKPDVYKYGVSLLKMNEYLYAGTCILFGFRFKDNEVTESGAGLLYKPYQALDLADKIQYLYELNDAERKKYGEHAREYYKKNHSVKVLTDKLLEMLF